MYLNDRVDAQEMGAVTTYSDVLRCVGLLANAGRVAGRWPVWTVLVLLLGGCAHGPMYLPSPLPDPPSDGPDSMVSAQPPAPDQLRTRIETLTPPPALGARDHPKEVAEGFVLPPGELTLNADALPLNRFVQLALSEVLGLSLQVDPAVASRTDPVTLHLAEPVNAPRLLGMVEDVLRLFDVALVRGQSGVRVLPRAKVAQTPPDIVVPGARNLVRLGRVIELFPLRYAEPAEAIGFMQQFLRMGTTGAVIVNKRLHALILVGEAAAVARARRAIAIVDRPTFEHQHLRLVYPVYWQVDALRKVLEKTAQAESIPVAGESHRSGLYMIPVEELNALILASPEGAWMRTMLDIIKRLDAPGPLGQGRKMFIYAIKNTRAKDLGAVIVDVLSGRSGAVEKRHGLPPRREATKVLAAPEVKKSQGASAESETSLAEATAPGMAGGLSVVMDETQNILVFSGSAKAYRDVLPLLEQLDKPPRQVLIEATIAEVDLDNSTQFGVEFSLSDAGIAQGYRGTLSTLAGLGVGDAGLTARLVNLAGEVRLKLNALASEGKARVLSSPRLLAMDNEQARIQVGDQIAILSQEVGTAEATTGASTGLLRSFSYVDTGVILDVTPTINDGGVVQLKVHQEVSTPGASNNNTPPISRRSVDTTLVAKSGQSVLIGGLISRNNTVGRTKVPVLGDIPVLGQLFSNDTLTDRAKELIVLITPHIISGPDDADYLTRAYQRQLNWTGTEIGGEPPKRH